jgi:glycosyltransferase involved in cell wall biosynthesis
MALPPRSVWVDAQGAQNIDTPERGIGRHIVEIVGALLDLAPEIVGAVGLNPALPALARLSRLEGSPLVKSPIAREEDLTELPLIYHLPSPFEGVRLERMWPSWARRGDVRTVVTLHDLVPLVFRERYLDPHPYWSAFYMGRVDLIREADRVLAVSQFSASDAVERLGIEERRITVIDSGVTSDMSSLASSEHEATGVLRAELPDVRERFLLYVGGDDWRKNLDGIVDAYALLPDELRRRHQLVIACRLTEERRRQLLSHADSAGVSSDDLLLTGFVSDHQLAALYRACELFLFPSLYEGAGLPILEAMSCGAPVVAARVASIPEVLGDLDGTFDPRDPADIARCVEHIVDDPDKLARLRHRSARRAAHFTWERVARLTLEGYEAALSLPARRRGRRRKRRLAVVTPWPPHPRSGLTPDQIADLVRTAEVDVIVPDGVDTGASVPTGASLHEATELEWVHALLEYDRFVYVLGSSPDHFHVVDCLMRRPGVVLGDLAQLGDLFRSLYRERYADDPDWLRETYEAYADPVLGPGIERGENGDREESFVRFGQRLVEARAERLIDPADAGVVVELLGL